MPTVTSNGQIIMGDADLPPQHTGFMQNIKGGLLEASAAKTASSISAQASQARGLGVTMRGSGKRRKMKGGTDARIPIIPEAHSIPGVSHDNVHLKLIDTFNQLGADSVGDKLINATPYKVGGFRFRETDEEPFGGRKTKKHGRRHKRTRGRRSRKHHNRSRRNKRTRK